MTDLPSTVVIGPYVFAVEVDADAHLRAEEEEDTRLYGRSAYAKAVININPHISEQLRRVTLLHEVLHTINFAHALGSMFEDERVEEWYISRLAPALLQVLRDNDDLLEMLLS